jgi:signal transduction histidine kinase
MGTSFWNVLLGWFQTNAQMPDWVPARWRQPLLGYLLAALLVLVALAVDAEIVHLTPAFDFVDLPITLTIFVVAFLWGTGPGLLATVLGTFLVYYLLVPPPFTLHVKDLVDIFQDGGILIAGLFITLVISQLHAQRRASEARTHEHAEQRRKMDAFLGVVTHELKTPLTAMQLQLQLAQRRLEEGLGMLEGPDRPEARTPSTTGTVRLQSLQHLIESLRELLAAARQQWGRLDQLVNDLLAMARIQTDQVVLCLQPVDVLPLIETVVHDYRQAMPERTIELVLPPPPLLSPCPSPDTSARPPTVTADPDRLEQVLRNYLANAVKYSRDTTPVTVGVAAEGELVRVWVRDEGPGLPLAEQARIWERFYQAPGIAVQSGSGVGLGIGLHISKSIIEAHHGHVGVQSTPGHGATFLFTLPQARE